MAKFTSASSKENGKAFTTTLDSVYEDLVGKVDPVKLSKIFTELKKQGTEAVLTIGANDETLFRSNRANGRTLKAKSFPGRQKPVTGKAVTYPVTGIRLVKTVTGV